jgi:hypothetical protein
MGILSKRNSSNNYTWYAYDHMAGTDPVAILTTEANISNIVSTNGIYLALQPRNLLGGGSWYSAKLWTAYTP